MSRSRAACPDPPHFPVIEDHATYQKVLRLKDELKIQLVEPETARDAAGQWTRLSNSAGFDQQAVPASASKVMVALDRAVVLANSVVELDADPGRPVEVVIADESNGADAVVPLD